MLYEMSLCQYDFFLEEEKACTADVHIRRKILVL